MPPDGYADAYFPTQVQIASLPAEGTLRTNAELNLSVLQRHNPLITGVLSIAHFAAIYVFSTSSQTWERTNVEGTLFVCQLAAEKVTHDLDSQQEERYQVMVLNRRGLENFELELCNADDVELSNEYIILRCEGKKRTNVEGGRENAGDETAAIYGLWIFTEHATSSTTDIRSRNAAVIQDCAIRAQMSRQSVLEKNMIASQQGKISDLNHATATPQATTGVFAEQGQRMVTSHSSADSGMRNGVTGSFGEPSSRDILGNLFHRARLEHHSNI